MNKKLLSLLLVTLFITSSIMAIPLASAGKNGQAGKSNVAHLYLYQKNPSTWTIVESGAWGKMKYNLAGEEFCFVFNGHGLKIDEPYTLIYYADPWNNENGMALASGSSDMYGNIHLSACVDTGDLPIPADDNYGSGAKIWLVTSSDCDENGEMSGWSPDDYLFEYDLINFDDTT